MKDENLPFQWYSTGQLILTFQAPMEMVNELNTLFDELTTLNELPKINQIWIRVFKKFEGFIFQEKNFIDVIPDVIRYQLRKYYKNDILKLQNLLCLDLSDWLDE